MAYPRSKAVLVFLALLPVYLGPYMYAYGRTQSNVFPTVETLDGQAMDDVKTGVDNSVTEIVAQSVTRTVNGQPVTWTEVTYTLPFRVLNRIFKTYINFPALLSVSKLTFQATGVFNGTEILSCHHYVDSLIAPTGFEVLAVFGSILKAGNNTVVLPWTRESDVRHGQAVTAKPWGRNNIASMDNRCHSQRRKGGGHSPVDRGSK